MRPWMAPTVMESWTSMGSSIASVLFVWTMLQRFFPSPIRQYVERYSHRLMAYFYPYVQISIHDFTGDRLQRNKVFTLVEAYLSQNTSKSGKRLKLEMGRASKKLVLTMDDHERTTDDYRGIKLWWVLSKVSSRVQQQHNSTYTEPDRRYFKLIFHKKYRDIITEEYLEHVIKTGKEITIANRQRKLYTNSSNHRWTGGHTMWSHVAFDHPATFRTLAMEPEKKQDIIDDLLAFANNKDFYGQIGKAWKRGYLLYGPPGTGKSTMIAAMANLLDYDVYDLELTAVQSNTELRKLLIETTSKSIIVIEDIDCSLELTGQRKKKPEEDEKKDQRKEGTSKNHQEEKISKVTLSGLLNFVDGLWSSCGKERIIVFTTNYVEKLDPALIRRGRMDKHIELSYCNFEGFKVLAGNYLALETHPLFDTVEKMISETTITPADVAESLMPRSPQENTERRLLNLVKALGEAKAAETSAAHAANKEAKHQNSNDMEKETVASEDKITPADVTESLMPRSPLENTEKRLSNPIQAALEETKEAETLTLANKESKDTFSSEDK